jgi:hypothetical protein
LSLRKISSHLKDELGCDISILYVRTEIVQFVRHPPSKIPNSSNTNHVLVCVRFSKNKTFDIEI